MTKEDLILAAVERIEGKQEGQRIAHEEFKSLLASYAVRITELEAGHGRHRDEHKRRDWWVFVGLIGMLGSALFWIWEHR